MRPPRRLARWAIQLATAMPIGPATIAGGSGAMGLSLFSFSARWRRMDGSTAGGGMAGSSLDPPSGGKVPPPPSSCGSCNAGVVVESFAAAAAAGTAAADSPITEPRNKAETDGETDAHRQALGADRKPRGLCLFRSEIRVTTTPKPTTARPAELNPLRPVWSSGIGVFRASRRVGSRQSGELLMR